MAEIITPVCYIILLLPFSIPSTAAETHALTLGVIVKASYSTTRGYYISLPSAVVDDYGYLPPEYIQPVINKKSIACTTEEILSLSDRAKESICLALSLTDRHIHATIELIRNDMEAVFLLVDSIALLDMLCSFADLVSMSDQSYVRPELNEGGVLSIRGGRHPMVSTLQSSAGKPVEAFIANDCFASDQNTFVIITGPNGSGKSTYIKQPALITLLAQMGCFVPAVQAVIPIRDKILSRIGMDDDMEHNISTFAMEMKEISYILENATSKSLIIIDELGRGTSNLDGIALAFAISEELIRRQVMTFFVTHYSQITSLPSIYASAVNIHLKTVIGTLVDGIQFLHRIENGPCTIKSGYGIMMAKLCNFPEAMVVEARAIQKIVRATYPVLVMNQVINRTRVTVETLIQRVKSLRESSLSAKDLRNYLADLVSSQTLMRNDILNYLNDQLKHLNLMSSNVIKMSQMDNLPTPLPICQLEGEVVKLESKDLSINFSETASSRCSTGIKIINDTIVEESAKDTTICDTLCDDESLITKQEETTDLQSLYAKSFHTESKIKQYNRNIMMETETNKIMGSHTLTEESCHVTEMPCYISVDIWSVPETQKNVYVHHKDTVSDSTSQGNDSHVVYVSEMNESLALKTDEKIDDDDQLIVTKQLHGEIVDQPFIIDLIKVISPVDDMIQGTDDNDLILEDFLVARIDDTKCENVENIYKSREVSRFIDATEQEQNLEVEICTAAQTNVTTVLGCMDHTKSEKLLSSPPRKKWKGID